MTDQEGLQRERPRCVGWSGPRPDGEALGDTVAPFPPRRTLRLPVWAWIAIGVPGLLLYPAVALLFVRTATAALAGTPDAAPAGAFAAACAASTTDLERLGAPTPMTKAG